MTANSARRLLDTPGVEDTLRRLAGEIAAADGDSPPTLIGIRRRGVQLAERIAALLRAGHGLEVTTGSLDITLYRDDLHQIGPRPVIGPTEIPEDVSGRRVVIVDDVLFTGRTVRAALQELSDFGRPRRVELCVLVDRGGRELPIQADYVGLSVPARTSDLVEVRVPELDGELTVTLVSASGEE